MFNIHDLHRNEMMLRGDFRREGYDWWWHSFTGVDEVTGEERQFFVEYFLVNPAKGGKLPILGQSPENKKAHRAPSYLMVKCGTWGKGAKQLHRFYGWKEVEVRARAPFHIQAAPCYASDDRIMGMVHVTAETAEKYPEMMSDSGTMFWDLRLKKQIAFNVGYGAGELFRRLQAFDMYWHAEGMKTLYDGTVVLDGITYRVSPSTCYGYADKNWGRDFTSPWVWLSSCGCKSRITGKKLNNTVFDIGGGCPVVFGKPLERKLLGAMYYEGREFEYNFSKFWTLPQTRFSFKETEDEVIWKVWQENATSLMKVDIRCKKADMIFVNYEDPKGRKRHNRLWNGGNGYGRVRLYAKTGFGGSLKLIEDMDVDHVGCEYGTY